MNIASTKMQQYMYTQHTCTHNTHVHTTYMYTQHTCTHNIHVHTTYMYTQHTCTHNIHVHTTYMYTQHTLYMYTHTNTHTHTHTYMYTHTHKHTAYNTYMSSGMRTLDTCTLTSHLCVSDLSPVMKDMMPRGSWSGSFPVVDPSLRKDLASW